MRSTFIVMCGVPASGKTTLARKIKNSLSTNITNTFKDVIVHVSYDELLPNVLNHESDAESESKKFRHVIFESLKTVLLNSNDVTSVNESEKFDADSQSIRSKVLKAFPSNLDHCDRLYLIIDDNMYYKSMREECLKFASTFASSHLAIIYLDCPLSLALTRNSKRTTSERVSEATIVKMWNILKDEMTETMDLKGKSSAAKNGVLDSLTFTYAVAENEGVVVEKDRYTVCLNFLENVPTLKTLYDPTAIETRLRGRVLAGQRDSERNLGNVAHRADNIMRRAIGKIARENDSSLKLTHLNRVRKEILAEIKTNSAFWILSEAELGCINGNTVYYFDQGSGQSPLSLDRYFLSRCHLGDP